MILDKYTKQPGETKDYDIDYSEWLSPLTDTLSGVTAAVECLTDPTDIALVCNTVFVTTTTAKFWMSGGTAGNKYKLTATATTTGGRTDESELVFNIKDF
jgi:hypothetical protein